MEFMSKRKIRDVYNPGNNWPLVCRSDGCYARIGIYHHDFFRHDALALQNPVDDETKAYISKYLVVNCPACDAPYPLSRHDITESEGFPSEETLSLRRLSSRLRREYRKKQRLESKLSDE